MLVSGVRQSDSVIHMHECILFQILSPHRSLQSIEEDSLCYTVGPCSFTLNIVVCTLHWLLLFKFIYFLWKDNCFTDFCCFLSNLNMNQPWVYIHPLPFELPSHLPSHPTPLGWHRAPVWISWAICKFPLAIYFTYRNVSFHVLLSIHLTLSFPFPMSVSLFSMSVSLLLPCK